VALLSSFGARNYRRDGTRQWSGQPSAALDAVRDLAEFADPFDFFLDVPPIVRLLRHRGRGDLFLRIVVGQLVHPLVDGRLYPVVSDTFNSADALLYKYSGDRDCATPIASDAIFAESRANWAVDRANLARSFGSCGNPYRRGGCGDYRSGPLSSPDNRLAGRSGSDRVGNGSAIPCPDGLVLSGRDVE